MSSDERFIVELIKALHAVKLDAVIVGNTAAILQGAPVLTEDVDLLVRATPLARERVKELATALGGALFRPNDLVDVLTIQGGGAPVDVIFGHLSGNLRFESIKSRARTISVLGQLAVVADLADVILSKETANRAKDVAVLPTLRSTLAIRQAREASGA